MVSAGNDNLGFTCGYGALTNLYKGTDGATNWIKSTNWMTGDPCTDTWTGVNCSSGGDVVALDLRRVDLSGTVPTEMVGPNKPRPLLPCFPVLPWPAPARPTHVTWSPHRRGG